MCARASRKEAYSAKGYTLFDHRGNLNMDGARPYLEALYQKETGKAKANLQDKAGEEWLGEYIDTISGGNFTRSLFAGTTNTGAHKYVAATPENIVKEMRKEMREGGMVRGPSEAIGKIRPPLRTLSAVRKTASERVKGRPADEVPMPNEAAEELSDVTFEYAPTVREGIGSSWGSDWAAAETIVDRLVEAKGNPQRAVDIIKREFPNVGPPPEGWVGRMQGVIDKTLNAPLPFLEAKPMRVVPMEDVAAVVVPKVFPKSVRAELEARGIEVRTKRADMSDEELAEMQSVESALFQREEGKQPAEQPAAPGKARIKLQRRFSEAQGKVRDDIERIGRDVFGKGFGVEVAERITAPDGDLASGAYDPMSRIAYVAMRSEEGGMTGALYHEGLHHLRNMGAFSDAKGEPNAAWKTLERQAVKDWRARYEIDQRYAGDVAGMDPEAAERMMTEEAIAEALADYQTRGKETGFGPTVRAALDRILNFFKRMANGLRGRGFDTWESIFEGDVATGKAGKRADAGTAQKAEVDRYLMTAWHGSPHKFDKFSTEAIGTGEGAQVYGHGLYFAERKGVAEWYQKKFESQNPPTLRVHGEEVDSEQHATILRLKDMVDSGDVSSAEFMSEVRRISENARSRLGKGRVFMEGAPPTEEFVSLWESITAPGDVEVERKSASLYKVDLAPAEDEYLLWDKQLSEQSAKVREALRDMGRVPTNEDVTLHDKGLQEEVRTGATTPEAARDRLIGESRALPEGTDERLDNTDDINALHDAISDADRVGTGESIYRDVSDEEFSNDDQEASNAMLRAGIRGIKYADATSRGKDEQSHNYVIFDDADVSIEDVLLQRGKDSPKANKDAFDAAASRYAGVDLRGIHEAVIKDKDRMGGLAETIKTQIKGVESIRHENVEVMDVMDQKDVAYQMRMLAPSLVSSRNHKAVNEVFQDGIISSEKESNWTKRWNKRFDRATKDLSEDEFADLSGVLFLGDADQHVFSEEELRDQLKVSKKTRTAYRKVRIIFDKLGTMVDNHNRSMILPLLTRRTQLVRRMAAARGMDLKEFRELFNKRAKLIEQQRNGEGDPEVLADAIDEATEALHGKAAEDLRRTATERGRSPAEAKQDAADYETTSTEADVAQGRIGNNTIKTRKGYVPHKFFGQWRILDRLARMRTAIRSGSMWPESTDSGSHATMQFAPQPTWLAMARTPVS